MSRPQLLIDLEPAIVTFGARLITGEEATHNGVPEDPKERECLLVFEHGGHCYAVRVQHNRMPFCNLSVRRVEEQSWPTTHLVTRTVDAILDRVRDIENPPPQQTRKPKTPKKGRK